MANAKAPVKVQYRSMLAKAQLATEANNITRTFQAISPFMQVDPQSADLIDSEEGIKFIANLYGLPSQIIRDKNEVEAIRRGRAQAQEAQMQKEKENEQADQINKIAPTMKMMMGNGGAGGTGK